MIDLPLRHGCYLAGFRWNDDPAVYDGTLRVDRLPVSGDLYLRTGQAPDPTRGIPVLPRADYRYYLYVPGMSGRDDAVDLELQLYTYDRRSQRLVSDAKLQARLYARGAAQGYPSPEDHYTGSVFRDGSAVGELTLGWVSNDFRRAVIEIDRVSGSEHPRGPDPSVGWGTVFEAAGWQVRVLERPDGVARVPAGREVWTRAELHATLLEIRKAREANLDREWGYHLLCVPWIEGGGFGVMYDLGENDVNNTPREGAAIASHTTTLGRLGYGRGSRYGELPGPYFRTAVHEIGHAMGLGHNETDNGFMSPTKTIVDQSPERFLENIEWSFADNDLRALRHWADPLVRPGMARYRGESADRALHDRPELSLSVRLLPTYTTVPLGAPVRVHLELENTGGATVNAPARLSFKSGIVAGTVTGPNGVHRSFRTIVRCMDDGNPTLRELAAGEAMRHDLTLLGGPDGPLFPTAGPHRILVHATWDDRGTWCQVGGEARVEVTEPPEDGQLEAARRILETPDTLQVLVMGGHHLSDGIEAIQGALQDPILAPHFAFVEAKRMLNPFFDRGIEAERASELLARDVVVSGAEIGSIAALAKETTGPARGRIAGRLAELMQGVSVDAATRKLVENL